MVKVLLEGETLRVIRQSVDTKGDDLALLDKCGTTGLQERLENIRKGSELIDSIGSMMLRVVCTELPDGSTITLTLTANNKATD